jgi:uncharacterized protein (TIGR02246 family)
MWTVAKVQDTDVLRDVLDQWRAGVDAHQPQRVAAVFTEDAIFQGLRPYSVGRDGVANYYDSQPLGMTATYRILETRRPTEDLVLGYVRADFTFPDRATVSLNLGVLITHGCAGWHILHYQASPAV